MNKPVPDKAEVTIEYPDKLYIGTFEHSSRFDAHFDEHGISRTAMRMPLDEPHRALLSQAAGALYAVLAQTADER
jgi:hypothetical protein